jgi:fructose-1,6-bisphosphatase/inositol monophosphatase family enzyme
MNTEYWLKVCRQAGEELFLEIRKHKKDKIKKILGVGASGDKTLWIDDLAEKIIFDSFKSTEKSFLFVSEEMGRVTVGKNPEIAVFVDPLDGSNNMKFGLPFVSVSIGIGDLSEKMSGMKIGYVKNLVTGDYYHAIKDEGAFKNDKRIRVSEEDVGCLIVDVVKEREKNFGRVAKLGKNFRFVRMLGSACLAMCFLAEGCVDAYLGLGATKTIDYPSTQLIVREAGGIVRDLQGKDLIDYKISLNLRIDFIAARSEETYSKIKSILSE